MTLQEFVAEERARLDAFEQFWWTNMWNKPDEFPQEQEPGDWDEQFFAFVPEETP